MREFEVEHPYSFPIEMVFAAKCRPDYWLGAYEALGQVNAEVLECAQQGELMRIRTRRDVPSRVPRFASAVLAPYITVVQQDEWMMPDETGGRLGRWAAEAPGRPISMRGTMELVWLGPRQCREVIRGQVEVSVPVLGGMIAHLVASDTRRKLGVSHRFTERFLAEIAGSGEPTPT